MTEKARYGSDGLLSSRYAWKYDTKGNLVEELSSVNSPVKGNPLSIIVYEITYRD
jgi:hypothetical protein